MDSWRRGRMATVMQLTPSFTTMTATLLAQMTRRKKRRRRKEERGQRRCTQMMRAQRWVRCWLLLAGG